MSHVSIGMSSSAKVWNAIHLLTDRVKGRGPGYINPAYLPSNPPATVFSRPALLKRTILSSLSAASALQLRHQMAPTTGRHERSSKMHSKVVGRPSVRSVRQFSITSSLGHHRLWTRRAHRSHLPGSGQPQACPLRGFHGERFRGWRSTDHNYRWCVSHFHRSLSMH